MSSDQTGNLRPCASAHHPITASKRTPLLAALPVALLLSSCGGDGGDRPGGGTGHQAGGEANLALPGLSQVSFFGIDGHMLLSSGLVMCAIGLAFGLLNLLQLRNLPVHAPMREISELIYRTCKAYLIQQGKFLLMLWVFIASVIFVYFKVLLDFSWAKVSIVLLFSLIGMIGSYGIAWYGIRVNTFANSRTAFASMCGKPYPVHAIPLKSGMSVGMVLISVELFMMLVIMLFLPGSIAGACFIGFAIGESLGASALRIAGGIFTKIADIGSDLMKIVFRIKEDDARNPGVIADCTGDNAGDSVGPSADGFETYGVTGVAMVTFILLAVHDPLIQVRLLVWLFFIRVVMVAASLLSYAITYAVTRARHRDAQTMDFEGPLTLLVWVTSLLSIALTFASSALLIGELGHGMWWKMAAIVSLGTLAGALIPELVKLFTSVHSRHTREVVKSAEQGGASLDILSGLVAGNFSAYWLGIAIIGLMSGAYLISTLGLRTLMIAPAVFAFGLVAFGFLGIGPVTIAVDSYGPVTDNAQSVYELSTIEHIPGIDEQIREEFGFTVQSDRAKHFLEENDGAGNTFKATASVAMNPVIKFTTLFGLLAVELAVSITAQGGGTLTTVLAAVFFVLSMVFVARSFYGMRIDADMEALAAQQVAELEDSQEQEARSTQPVTG